jgi:type IV pilus assembly protein PilF
MAAIIHDRNGEPAKAEREFGRALAIAPADGFILNAHASWLCENGRASEADQEFLRALRDPRYRTPLQTLANAGRCAHQVRQWGKAESYLRRALELAPADGTILFLLADVELKQGKFMEARAFIQRRDALGADASTLELAAAIEDAAGDALSAARYRQRLKEKFPDAAPAGQGAGKS